MFSMREAIGQSLLEVQRDSEELVEEIDQQTQAERGFEIMSLFVQDILGRHTAAAKIVAMKMEMDCEKLPRVGKWTKVSIALLLVVLNGFFFYYTLLRGISKGLAWQVSFLTAWVLQVVLDVFLFETMQVAWFQYFIPSLVHKEVCKAKEVLEQTAVKAMQSLQRFPYTNPVDLSELNAPDYLFVSFQLARTYPRQAESFLVRHYRSYLPGMMEAEWQKQMTKNRSQQPLTASVVPHHDVESHSQGVAAELDADAAQEIDKQRQSLVLLDRIRRVVSYVQCVLIALVLQGVVLAPVHVQVIFVRVLEPIVWWGILFLLLEVSSRPIFLALTVLLVALLLGSLVWQHVSMARQARKVTGSWLDSMPEPVAVALTGTGRDQTIVQDGSNAVEIVHSDQHVDGSRQEVSMSQHSSVALHLSDDGGDDDYDVMFDEEYSLSLSDQSSLSADSRSSSFESKQSSSHKVVRMLSSSSSESSSASDWSDSCDDMDND